MEFANPPYDLSEMEQVIKELSARGKGMFYLNQDYMTITEKEFKIMSYLLLRMGQDKTPDGKLFLEKTYSQKDGTYRVPVRR